MRNIRYMLWLRIAIALMAVCSTNRSFCAQEWDDFNPETDVWVLDDFVVCEDAWVDDFSAYDVYVPSDDDITWYEEESGGPSAPDPDLSWVFDPMDALDYASFTPAQLERAKEFLRQRVPEAFFNQYIRDAKVILNVRPNNSTNAAGQSTIVGGVVTIQINPNATDAFKSYTGTEREFLASVVLHEVFHAANYLEGKNAAYANSGATQAQEEASVRAYVEQWAIDNYMPETSPHARAADGTVDVSAIYQEVLSENAYSTTPGSANL